MLNSSALHQVDSSARARRLFWHLLSIGSVALYQPDRHGGMDKPGAHLFWVQSGRGRLEVPGKSYPVKPGPQCWLVDMKQPRTYTPSRGRRLVLAGFRFGGPDLEAWREELGEERQFDLSNEDFDAITASVRKLESLARNPPERFEWEIHMQISDVLGRLFQARHLLTGPGLDIPAPLSRALAIIMADPARDWRVPDLADASGASESTLQRMFKEFQHESIHEYLLRIRADQARQLLCDARLTVKEVAARLNFSSGFYFSRFFRKRTGLSPRQFRATLKQP